MAMACKRQFASRSRLSGRNKVSGAM
jgi:hypothetical protein